jgi:Asp-tRNA(Asn)/Glu-tRNA(Gln) amidotransferase A subunit family amidase
MTAYADYVPLTFHDAARPVHRRQRQPARLPRALPRDHRAARAAGEGLHRDQRDGRAAAADASAERWKAGKPLSPIDGMPIAIKDLLETRDMPTEMGCAAMKGNFPKRDNAASGRCARRAR